MVVSHCSIDNGSHRSHWPLVSHYSGKTQTQQTAHCQPTGAGIICPAWPATPPRPTSANQGQPQTGLTSPGTPLVRTGGQPLTDLPMV